MLVEVEVFSGAASSSLYSAGFFQWFILLSVLVVTATGTI